jgi:hypothetical protein
VKNWPQNCGRKSLAVGEKILIGKCSVRNHFILQMEMEKKTRIRRQFTREEDALLKQLVAASGEGEWGRKAKHFTGRTYRELRERWKNYLSPGIGRRDWSAEEDALLRRLVAEHGHRWANFKRYFVGTTDIHIKNRWAVLMSRDRKKSGVITTELHPPPPTSNRANGFTEPAISLGDGDASELPDDDRLLECNWELTSFDNFEFTGDDVP